MDSISISIDQLVGNTLGSYQIDQLLGHGSVNAVYLARSAQQKSVMFTAFILPQECSLQARELFRERFTRVASALTKLSHPHVLPVYDFGEQLGYPYIVTPLVTTGSLAKVLKQQSRLNPTQILQILPQVAEGLDYVHSQGIVHGTLKCTNILLDSEQKVQIAGFGLFNILEIRGIEQFSHPYAHLFSIARTFLGPPEYIAPEVVQGAPLDARSDLYALGAMLFELLSGKPPFSGSDPLAIALQRVQQPVPSLLAHISGLPPALDLVIHRALEPDPAQRYQSANKLVSAFERVLKVIDAAQISPSTPMPGINSKSPFLHSTLSPEPAWLAKDALKTQQPDIANTELNGRFSRGWQPGVTDQVPALKSPTTSQPSFLPQTKTANGTGQEKLDSPREMTVDPFVWWSTTSVAAVPHHSADQQKTSTSAPITDTLPNPYASQQRPDTSPLSSNTMLNTAAPAAIMGRQPLPSQKPTATQPLDGKQQRSVDKGRRRTVALLAASGIVVIGALGVGGINLANKLYSTNHLADGVAQTNATPPGPTRAASTTTTAKSNSAAGQKPGSIPSTTRSSTAPTPKATPPTPSPKPGHTGTVVGATNQATNTSMTFSNPADGNNSLLIHLPNGNFVAFESACTHEGVTCYYNTGTQKIVCPRHNAMFDPANNATVLQGPAPKPLASVPVQVNADGTITAA